MISFFLKFRKFLTPKLNSNKFFYKFVKEDWSSILKRIRKYPNDIKAIKFGEFYSLQVAIMFHAPSEVIQALVDVDPESIDRLTLSNENALHLSCRFGVHESVIRFLLNKKIEMLYDIDCNGDTPMHLILRSTRSVDKMKIITIFLERIGEVKRICCSLPLLSEHQREVRSFLVDSPNLLLLTNRKGNNILHLLCSYNWEKLWLYETVMRLVGNEYDKLLLAKNEDGLTPLDICLEIGSIDEHVRAFVTIHTFKAKNC